MIAKLILDKYASIVIPKNNQTIGYNPNLKRPYFVKAKWKTEAEKYQYSNLGCNVTLCLWVPPINSLVIEFEGTRGQNLLWIEQTEANCNKYGLQYCVCDHEGKSPYLWLFNIEGLNNHNQKKELAKLLIPKDARVDWTNLGSTLVPIIELKHWKHNREHKIIRGVSPLEQKNKLPGTIQHTAAKNKTFFLCDDYIHDTTIKKIISTDFKVQRLLVGNLDRYASPSEARLALYCCLVAYGLTDDQVYSVMGMSQGLNFYEKPWLQQKELDKARSYVTKKRLVYSEYSK